MRLPVWAQRLCARSVVMEAWQTHVATLLSVRLLVFAVSNIYSFKRVSVPLSRTQWLNQTHVATLLSVRLLLSCSCIE
jgi:plasmid replication initiation protein